MSMSPEPPIAAGHAKEEIEQPQDESPGRDIEEERMHGGREHADGTARRGVNHAQPHHPHADRALPGAADGEGVVDR